jgi:hypothetical protein
MSADAIQVYFFLAVGGFIAWKLYQAQHAGDGPSEQIVCPHCQTKGGVVVTSAQRKKGLSGGKVTGGLMTAGVSLFATGLSRKQWVKHLRCSSCRMEWDVE